MSKTLDEMLQSPYWIVDILPEQVPADAPGQYFAVEKYFLDTQLDEIKQKHINLVLKLNCYRNISIIDEDAAGDVALKGDEKSGSNVTVDPPPENVAEEMRRRYMYIMVDSAMILSEPDDTHLTIFGPDEQLLELVRTLAAGEGLYVWQPPEQITQ